MTASESNGASTIGLGTVPVSKGGTGATSASAARSSLGVKTASELFPVNTVIARYDTTSPASVYGGTWTQIGSGRQLVGYDSKNPAFNSVGKTGGSNQLTFNARKQNGASSYYGGNDTGIWIFPKINLSSDAKIRARIHTESALGWKQNSGVWETKAAINWNTDNTTYINSVESDASVNVDSHDPYIVVTFWRRTA